METNVTNFVSSQRIWHVIYQKTSLTGTVIELFSTLHFSLKHGGSVSETARQQTYCASILEQGGGDP